MKRILALGAGQLGHMLAAAGARLGLTVDRFDLATDEVIAGTSNHRWKPDVETLTAQYDVITAELEHLPDSVAVRLLCASANWINARALEILSQRAKEKAFLDQQAVPTAAWSRIDRVEDFRRMQREQGDLVVKTVRHGYDGRGQWRLGALDVPPESLRDELGSLIAEKRVDFRRELSLVGARWATGKTLFYPLVETYHKDGILRYCLAPARIEKAHQQRAEANLERVMEGLDYVGVMAMECFETGEGLIVNEIAPRVHNSGHWTQFGASLSQFDLHLRAIVDLPARMTHRSAVPTLMLNLIGIDFNPAWLDVEGLQCHWYGKTPRRGRKLGHINMALDMANDEGRIGGLVAHLDADHRQVLQRAVDSVRAQIA